MKKLPLKKRHYEIINKKELKKSLDKLSATFFSKKQQAKMELYLAKKGLRKTKNRAERINELKQKYQKELQEIKQWYLAEKQKLQSHHTHSVDQEQFDQFHAKEAFDQTNIINKLYGYLTLTSNQKKIYKKIKEKTDKTINSKKKGFAKSNVFEAENFNFYYGQNQTLFDINIKIRRKKVTAFIGPSGCGKSTFLRCLNRMNDQIHDTHSDGNIYFNDGTNLKSKNLSTLILTTRVGMIFQKPTPFPMSIYENIAYGPKSHGITDKHLLDQIVKESLESAALWDEVKDKLFAPATALSGGQQQRLCIARAIALKPEVLLMDESTSGLDPIATAKIENLINRLKKDYTIILVTHSMAQVQRVSDFTAFFYKGRLIEFGPTREVFINPKHKKTRDYISGKIG